MKKWPTCMVVSFLVGAQQIAACLWDRDTIASELARFPGVAEVMTGQFPRHSREFCEWRRKSCEEALASDPSQLGLYDDLAVAQHKLGDHKAAISTMLKKDKVKPNLYETCSNIGTFYIYTGELTQALLWINRALAINPNAHFGREKYQKWLVEWLVECDDWTSIDARLPAHEMTPAGYAGFVARKQTDARLLREPEYKVVLTEAQRTEALNAVLGMMWFADFDNPILQVALADLLVSGTLDENAAQLAALAYLHASRKVEESGQKERLFELFERSLALTLHLKDESSKARKTRFESMLDNGLAKGRQLNEAVKSDELAWISARQDASAEFEKKYLSKYLKQ